jgi:hypothetical protein
MLESLLDALASRPRAVGEAAARRARRAPARRGGARRRGRLAARERLLVELVRGADARARERALAELATLRLATLRRLQEPLAAGLSAPEVRRIEALLRGTDLASLPERRRELVMLLGRRPDLADLDALRSLRASDPDPETRIAALRVLLATPEREATLGRLRPFLGGLRPADDEARDEIYELLGAFPLPLRPRGALAGRAAAPVLSAREPRDPRAAAGEPAGTGRRPRARDGRGPAAAQQRRRGSRGGCRGSARSSRRIRCTPRSSTRRLGAALVLLSADRALLAQVGPPLAEILLMAPDPDRGHDGIAHLVLGGDAEARQDHEAAARHLGRALESFAEGRPAPPVTAQPARRRELVRRGPPVRGARGARARAAAARAAAARGDREAARREAAAAKLLAVGDRASMRSIETLELELFEMMNLLPFPFLALALVTAAGAQSTPTRPTPPSPRRPPACTG